MLEQPVLLLTPWEGGTARPPRRVIRDPRVGQPLGCVYRRPAPAASWLRWLMPPVLYVHEADDEPLLCTVHRGWGLTPYWEVRDADGHRVGSVRGRVLRDRGGRCLAVREWAPGRALLWFRGPDGRTLGTLTRGPDGLWLEFAPELEREPLVKMVLLAAALSEDA